MKIHRPNPQILIVTKSRLSNIGKLVVSIIMLCVWYFLFLVEIGGGSLSPVWWIFYLSPLFGLPFMYKMLKIAVVGERFSFDGMTHTILKNHKPLAKFNEVMDLRVRTTHPGDMSWHRLTVVLVSGKKIEIHASDNLDEINSLRDSVADIVFYRK